MPRSIHDSLPWLQACQHLRNLLVRNILRDFCPPLIILWSISLWNSWPCLKNGWHPIWFELQRCQRFHEDYCWYIHGFSRAATTVMIARWYSVWVIGLLMSVSSMKDISIFSLVSSIWEYMRSLSCDMSVGGSSSVNVTCRIFCVSSSGILGWGCRLDEKYEVHLHNSFSNFSHIYSQSVSG